MVMLVMIVVLTVMLILQKLSVVSLRIFFMMKLYMGFAFL